MQTELDRLVKILLRQFELDAEQAETQESADMMGRLQECGEAGDAYMTAAQRLVLFRQLEPAISLDVINHRAQQLYGFASTGGKGSLLRHLFVCGPTHNREGEDFELLDEKTLSKIIAEASDHAQPYKDTVQVPDYLCSDEEIQALERQVNPSWAVLPEEITRQPSAEVSEGGRRAVSKEMGITMLRLENGVRVMYKKTPFEKKQFTMEIHLLGGRACEGYVEGIRTGALSLGVQAAMVSCPRCIYWSCCCCCSSSRQSVRVHARADS